MGSRILVLALLLTAAVSAVSQKSVAPSETPTTPATIQGCLKANGNAFTLTDKASSTVYYLEGDKNLLQQNVGRNVEPWLECSP